jgi:hypothetical protein
MKCIECDTVFTPKRKTAQFCSPYCRVKFNRKKLAEDGDPSVEFEPQLPEPVKPAKAPSASHVVALKQRVKDRILAKSTPLEEILPDQLQAGMVKLRNHAQDLVNEGVVSQKTADDAVKLVLNTFVPHPVENHGNVNDLARQVIFSRVKAPKETDLSKTQLPQSKS